MKKVLVTSEKFAGQAELLYNTESMLIQFDVSGCTIAPEVLKHFKNAVPVFYGHLAEALPNATMISGDVAITFEMFYAAYPLKRNRYKAEQYWQKMPVTDQVNAFTSLKAYSKYCSKLSWYTPMIADKYLRAREFETDWLTILKQQG